MRKKLPENEKRSCIIGIKVKPELKKIIEYMAERDQETMSSYLEKIIEREVKHNMQIAHISHEDIFTKTEQ